MKRKTTATRSAATAAFMLAEECGQLSALARIDPTTADKRRKRAERLIAKFDTQGCEVAARWVEQARTYSFA